MLYHSNISQTAVVANGSNAITLGRPSIWRFCVVLMFVKMR